MTTPTKEAAAGHSDGHAAGVQYTLDMFAAVMRQMTTRLAPAEPRAGDVLHATQHAVTHGWQPDQIVIAMLSHGWTVYEHPQAAAEHMVDLLRQLRSAAR